MTNDVFSRVHDIFSAVSADGTHLKATVKENAKLDGDSVVSRESTVVLTIDSGIGGEYLDVASFEFYADDIPAFVGALEMTTPTVSAVHRVNPKPAGLPPEGTLITDKDGDEWVILGGNIIADKVVGWKQGNRFAEGKSLEDAYFILESSYGPLVWS